MATRSLGQLTVDFIARTAGFEQGVDRASRVTQQEMRKIQRNVTMVAGAITAFTAGFQAMALSVFNSTAQVVDSTAKMARQIGTTTETLTSMRFAVQEVVNISDGTFDAAMRRMNRRISEAAEGSGAAKKALDALGLSAADLAQMTVDEQLYAVSDAMQKVGEHGQRLRHTMAIFDTEGMPLVDALGKGGDYLRDMANEAERFGAVIKDVDATAMEDAVTAINHLKTQFTSLTQEIAFAMAPVVKSMAESMTGFIRSLELDGETIRGIFKGIATAALGASTVLAMQAIPTMIKAVTAFSTALFALPIGWVVATVGIAVTAMLAFNEKITMSSKSMDGLKAALNLGIDAIHSLVKWLFNLTGESDDAWINIGDGFDSMISFILSGWDMLINGFVGGLSAIYAAAKVATHNLYIAFENAFKLVLKGVYSMVDSITAALSHVPGLDSMATNLSGSVGELSDFKNIIEGMGTAWQNTSVSNMHAAYELERTLVTLERFMSTPAEGKLNSVAEALGGASGGGSGKGVAGGAKKANDALRQLLDTLFPLQKLQADLQKDLALVSTAYQQGKISADVYQKSLAELNKRYQEQSKQYLPDAIKKVNDLIESTKLRNEQLKEQIKHFGLSGSAIAKLTRQETRLRVSELESAKAKLISTNASQEKVQAIEQEIEKLKELIQLQGDTVLAEMVLETKQAYEEVAQEAKRLNEEIGNTLTDALMRGFEGGKGFAKNLRDTVVNMFKTMVLRPIIQPVMQSVSSAITGALGIGGKAASSVGGVSNILSGVSSLSQLGSAISGGFVSSVASGISSIGSAFGSSAISSFAAGMKGSTLAAGLAGPTTAGASGAMGLGASVGAAMPWLGGAASVFGIGSMIHKMTQGETRSGGGFVYDPSTGGTRYAGGPSGGYGGQGTINQVGMLFKGAADTLNEVFKGVGADVTTNFFHGAFESSEKGRGGVFSGGMLNVAGVDIGFGGARKGDGFGGTSGSAEEMFANLQTDVSYSLLEGFKAASSELPDVFKRALDGVDVRSLSVEYAQELAAGLVMTVRTVNALQDAFNALPFNNLKNLTFDVAESIMSLSGGMENLLSNVGGYYDYFVPESERMANGVRAMTSELRSAGITLPRTRDEFRGIVEALDLTTAAGQGAWVALMNAADAANDYYHAIESATAGVANSISELYQRIELDIMASDEERYNYYKRQFESLSQQLSFADDAAVINELVGKMTSVASNAYGLLDEDARKGGTGKEYLQTLDDLQRVADERLEAAYRKATEDKARELEIVGGAITSSLVASLDASGRNMAQSAAQIGSWASGVNSSLNSVASAVSRIGTGSEVTY